MLKIYKDRLDETHFDRNSTFYRHYSEHVAKNYSEFFRETDDELFEPMTEDQYDQFADELTKEPVTTSDYRTSDNVVGFMSKSGRIIKYRKSLDEIVVYVCNKNDAKTVTYYKAKSHPKHHRYRELLSRDYLIELTPEDDKYNI